MKIEKEKLKSSCYRFSVKKGEQEVGRVYVYLIRNDIHKRPYAFIEDVHIAEGHRGQGVGKELMKLVQEEVKEMNCYKIVLCCKHENSKAYKFYEGLSYKDMGTKFRVDL
jgi:ribosomal protein S18 acetylase RimI-like enzyme